MHSYQFIIIVLLVLAGFLYTNFQIAEVRSEIMAGRLIETKYTGSSNFGDVIIALTFAYIALRFVNGFSDIWKMFLPDGGGTSGSSGSNGSGWFDNWFGSSGGSGSQPQAQTQPQRTGPPTHYYNPQVIPNKPHIDTFPTPQKTPTDQPYLQPEENPTQEQEKNQWDSLMKDLEENYK